MLSLGLGLMDDVCHQEVEQIQGIIHRDDFEGPCKGEQRGQPALWGHARNGLSPRGRAVAGSSTEPIRREMADREGTHADGPDVFEPLQGGH